MRPLIALPVMLALSGCGAGSGVVQNDERPVMSGNPVRDAYATDLHEFKRTGLVKAEVLARVGGTASQLKTPDDLRKLPHSELSTVILSPEALAERKLEYGRSAETYHVLAEGGSDMILFFESEGRLREYFHF
ncbi:hypothetical protein OJ996_23400 [Luteolibacter sp. GHJ8]|uniref:Beta-barrel assembly machine subunit BamE n=1 Tax=Luteolibacter rhizosphaerae TaxID=2989719 RepID=A0ABT3G9N3_9BACT|nr:hypothetical protein [Luteolibacter rhizosphaerae]MCW1916553.1 hypothetical protein [Luteolibacter rhizosphaerae]